MSIQRTNPDLDYLPPATFTSLGFHQLVSTDELLFVGGTAPFHGEGIELIGAGDLSAQCSYVLDVLERSLKAGGSSPEHVLDWTVYLTDPDRTGEIGSKYTAITPLLRDWVGPHGPAATAVGVACLFHPQQLIEIQAVAAVVK